MIEQSDFSYMANLYMALADQTRLKLLLQMYGGEVCVGEFTDALGDSQPKISRHLAYLRNAGIVDTRRSGKWIHYSIRWPEEEGGRVMLKAALEWLAGGQAAAPIHIQTQPDAVATEDPERYPLDIYGDADMTDDEFDTSGSSHNELEEFLL
jgi:DNA-binding transcriptional ArsR family regulator